MGEQNRPDRLLLAYTKWAHSEHGVPAKAAWAVLAKHARHRGFSSKDAHALILKLRDRYPDVEVTND